MRKFRNAALAGATAVAVAFGSTTVAVAAEDTNAQPVADAPANNEQPADTNEQPAADAPANNEQPADPEQDETQKGSKGSDIFGRKNWDKVEAGWKALYIGTWITGIVAVLALLIAPIDNFLKYGPGK